MAIDAATGAISQRRFDPFGVERGEKTGTWPGEKGYVGGTIDASTGLTHLGALLAVDIPPTVGYGELRQWLVGRVDSGDLEFQASAISAIHRSQLNDAS
ncbi:hypothetical protein [Streptomyces sp. NPDC057740]|uniref:hypothetical protein n=1 Tax=Streptomyces sp. NPDC057740 TaxID=3346234 RepID=UPI0036A44722